MAPPIASVAAVGVRVSSDFPGRSRTRLMVITLRPDATPEARRGEAGYQVVVAPDGPPVVMAAVGEGSLPPVAEIRAMAGVADAERIAEPFKLASRAFRKRSSVVKVGDVEIGGDAVVLMAGPCTIESEEQLVRTAQAVRAAGARVMRGGAFKPRTSPYSFQGLGEEGLKLLRRVADAHGLLVVSEVMDRSQIAMMAPYVDILQVGARNMQ